MKLKNGELWNAREPLEKLVALQLPVKTAYALAKLARKVNDQLQVISEVRNGLITKHGETVNGRVQITPESKNWAAFVAEHDELMDQEVEIVFDKPVLPASLEIDAVTLMALEKFIEVAG